MLIRSIAVASTDRRAMEAGPMLNESFLSTLSPCSACPVRRTSDGLHSIEIREFERYSPKDGESSSTNSNFHCVSYPCRVLLLVFVVVLLVATTGDAIVVMSSNRVAWPLCEFRERVVASMRRRKIIAGGLFKSGKLEYDFLIFYHP